MQTPWVMGPSAGPARPPRERRRATPLEKSCKSRFFLHRATLNAVFPRLQEPKICDEKMRRSPTCGLLLFLECWARSIWLARRARGFCFCCSLFWLFHNHLEGLSTSVGRSVKRERERQRERERLFPVCSEWFPFHFPSLKKWRSFFSPSCFS